MLGKIFRPKGWLIGTGIIHAIMGLIVPFSMSEDIAVMGWGENAVAAHDAFYEALMGVFIIPHVIVIFAAAFLFSGNTQAKLAGVLGGSVLLCFLAAAFHASGHGYLAETGLIASFTPPVVLFGGLTLAGALHWKDA